MFRREPRVLIVHEKPLFSDFEKPEALLELSGKLESSLSEDVKVSVSEVPENDPLLASTPEYAPARMRGLSFSVRLAKPSIAIYLNRSRELLEEINPKKDLANCDWRSIRNGYSTRSLYFNRVLHDDLFLIAKVAIIGNLVSQGVPLLPRYEVADFSTYRDPMHIRFDLSFNPKALNSTQYKLRPLDLYETIKFILDAGKARRNGRICSFSRGLNYLVRGLGKRNDDTSTIIWCVSALECFLSKPEETGSRGLLEARLSAVFRGDNEGAAIGDFRKIYRFRNEFLHGNQDIPIEIGGAALFPENIERPSQVLGEPSLAGSATALAVKVAQRMVEDQNFDFHFETTIKPSAQ